MADVAPIMPKKGVYIGASAIVIILYCFLTAKCKKIEVKTTKFTVLRWTVFA